MSKDYAALPRTDMRRSDRAVHDEEWIKQLLRRAAVGNLATVYDAQPFLNNNLFFYDEARHAIYLHTARVGRTQANLITNERVCFSIFEMGRLLPAQAALKFSVEYASVVIFGSGTQVRDEEEATRALHDLVEKYAPHLQRGEDYQPVLPEELARTGVYRISIEEWTGKKKQAPDDFPGAYYYGAL